MALVFGAMGAAFGLAPAFWMNALLLMSGALVMRADIGVQVLRRR